MLKTGRKRNPKSKFKTLPVEVTETHGEKKTHQTDISNFLSKLQDNSNLPEVSVSVPGPDDAALPCSTRLCYKKEEEEKCVRSDGEISVNDVKKEKGKVLTENVTKKKTKKQVPQLRNTQLTDYFPVRRSNRKTQLNVMKEKQKIVEDAILNGVEEGFEVKEFPGKGRGVITLKSIKRGDFVLEYFGELIDYEEAKKREPIYAAQNSGCYMYYFKNKSKTYCVDSTKESSRVGRLVNHSKKNGNLKTQVFLIEDNPHLVFFALRDIEPGEELSYDYGDRSRASQEAHPWLAL
ncbi:N-lysine methyltransferase SETD8, partial [Stegodyphus mimosarum]